MFAFILLLPVALFGQIEVPGEKWGEMSEKELEALGFEIKSLSKAWRYIRDETPVTGMLVAVNGKSTIYFGDIRELSYLASVRKSILAMMYGKYIENGTIKLDATLAELGIDDIQGLSSAEKKATIRHLLTATSGIYHPASNSGDDTRSAPKRGTKKPGEYFLYNNWDFNAAGAVFEKITGKNIYKAFNDDLAIPLGMQDFSLTRQRKTGNKNRSRHLAYHFVLSTRDMARLGVLMLNKGKWGSKQLVPAKWVSEITSAVTPNNKMNPDHHRRGPFGYGYMWWVWNGDKTPKGFEGAYIAQGYFGQYIAVLPELNMVAAVKTKAAYGRHTRSREIYTFLKLLVSANKRYAKPEQAK